MAEAERDESDAERTEAASGDPAARAPGRQRRPGGDVQAYIGRQLRAVYDDVAQQPVPDRFIELMKQLEAGVGKA